MKLSNKIVNFQFVYSELLNPQFFPYTPLQRLIKSLYYDFIVDKRKWILSRDGEVKILFPSVAFPFVVVVKGVIKRTF